LKQNLSSGNNKLGRKTAENSKNNNTKCERIQNQIS